MLRTNTDDLQGTRFRSLLCDAQVTDAAIGEQWTVLRRYRQFEELHRGLLPVLSREPDANAYTLPPKEVRLVSQVLALEKPQQLAALVIMVGTYYMAVMLSCGLWVTVAAVLLTHSDGIGGKQMVWCAPIYYCMFFLST